jgi:hypothetical protein
MIKVEEVFHVFEAVATRFLKYFTLWFKRISRLFTTRMKHCVRTTVKFEEKKRYKIEQNCR